VARIQPRAFLEGRLLDSTACSTLTRWVREADIEERFSSRKPLGEAAVLASLGMTAFRKGGMTELL
jgi:hypothetical protein